MSMKAVYSGLALAAALLALAADEACARAKPSDAPVRVELYAMSLCPFGVQAENGLLPAVKALGKSVELKIDFIAGEPAPSSATASRFDSLHGPAEVEEDLRQLCAMQLSPARYADYILERNKDYKAPRWREAARAAGLDLARLRSCAEGEQGAALLSASLRAARARGADSSPTVYVDGARYAGGRGVKPFTLALCAALASKGAPQPAACAQARLAPDAPAPAGGDCADGPAKSPVPFAISIVHDASCAACEPSLVAPLRERHPAATIEILDAASPRGQALISEHRARTLPLYVLGREVEQEAGFARLLDAAYARSAGRYIVKPGPGTYAPTVHLDRPRALRHLDVFVDPLSPFAARAEAELFDSLARSSIKDLTLSMHYLVREGAAVPAGGRESPADGKARAASIGELKDAAAGPLTAPGGEAGLRESLRQACLFQNGALGDFIAYLSCRNADLQAAGELCLGAAARLKECVEKGPGERLLRADARLSRALGVNAGFALLWENRYGPFGWHDADWKRLLEGGK